MEPGWAINGGRVFVDLRLPKGDRIRWGSPDEHVCLHNVADQTSVFHFNGGKARTATVKLVNRKWPLGVNSALQASINLFLPRHLQFGRRGLDAALDARLQLTRSNVWCADF